MKNKEKYYQKLLTKHGRGLCRIFDLGIQCGVPFNCMHSIDVVIFGMINKRIHNTFSFTHALSCQIELLMLNDAIPYLDMIDYA